MKFLNSVLRRNSEPNEVKAPQGAKAESVMGPSPLDALSDDDDDNIGKTRLLGFDTSDGRLELFQDSGNEAAPSKGCYMPVGWLVIVDGPGFGHGFALQAGLSTIGRNKDQTVSLDFGDNAISRTNHASIVYDEKSNEFLLGHGGKSNLVRLNDRPLVATEILSNDARIQIGETTLRFVSFCSEKFNWSPSMSDEEIERNVAYV
jgi:hypothetical protein